MRKNHAENTDWRKAIKFINIIIIIIVLNCFWFLKHFSNNKQSVRYTD